MPADLSPEIETVTNATTIAASATALINGIRGRIDDAVTKALANGATESELQPLREVSAGLKSQTQELSDAIQANTPEAA